MGHKQIQQGYALLHTPLLALKKQSQLPAVSAGSNSVSLALQTMMNAHGHGEVVLMSSSSQLFAVVADAYRRASAISTGDEIIILESAHEVSLLLEHVTPVRLSLSP